MPEEAVLSRLAELGLQNHQETERVVRQEETIELRKRSERLHLHPNLVFKWGMASAGKEVRFLRSKDGGLRTDAADKPVGQGIC